MFSLNIESTFALIFFISRLLKSGDLVNYSKQENLSIESLSEYDYLITSNSTMIGRLEKNYQKIITARGFHKITYNPGHFFKFEFFKSFLKIELKEKIFIYKKL